MLTKEDAQDFIGKVNALAMYVPPIVMKELAQCPACAVMAGIANGQVTVKAPETPAETPTEAPAATTGKRKRPAN